MKTTEENFHVHLDNKRIRSYRRQAAASWFAMGLFFFIPVGLAFVFLTCFCFFSFVANG